MCFHCNDGRPQYHHAFAGDCDDSCLGDQERRMLVAAGIMSPGGQIPVTVRPGDWLLAARQIELAREAADADVVWERCVKCKKQYRYPHLCREHMLCGLCHPPIE